MRPRIVILGGGTGGTLVANRLSRALGENVEIVVVDQDDRHVYQPGLLFVPFGLAEEAEIVRSRSEQLRPEIEFRLADVDHVALDDDVVWLEGGGELPYDVLVIATGARLQPEETEGLLGEGWGERVFTFYDLPGAAALRRALEHFEGGKLVVGLVDMPIKCPVAPLEFTFLADWYFHECQLRDRVEITYVTPLDGAFTKPIASQRLSALLEEKNVALVTEFNTGEVDGAGGRLISYDGREVPFDLLVTVPLHAGAAYVGRSPGLGDSFDFVPVDRHTLQSTVRPNVFAIGDATNVPTSKAGSVTHFEGEILVENVRRHLVGDALDASYDGHANCFIETGFHKALLIDFNYETEPLGGWFPTAAGPLPLLRESRVNHLGKLMFQWLYWHVLLPGRSIPGIDPELSLSGKEMAGAATRPKEGPL